MKRKRKEGSQGAGNSRSTAAMLLCVLLAVTAVAAGTLYAGEKSAKDDKAQAVSVQNEDVQTVNEGWQEAKDNPLREETDSGITKAVQKYYEERNIWIASWLYFSISRMCDWNWKCMEIPLPLRRDGRSRFYFDLLDLPACYGNSGACYGICCRTCK